VFSPACGEPEAGSCRPTPSCRRMTFPARGRRPRRWCRRAGPRGSRTAAVPPRGDRLAEGPAYEVVEPPLPAQVAPDGVMVMRERPERLARGDHRALLIGDEGTGCPAGQAGLVSHTVVPSSCLGHQGGCAEPNAPGSRRDGAPHRDTGANVKPGRRVREFCSPSGSSSSRIQGIWYRFPGMPGGFPFRRPDSYQKPAERARPGPIGARLTCRLPPRTAPRCRQGCGRGR
jgi:hypothetical protein